MVKFEINQAELSRRQWLKKNCFASDDMRACICSFGRSSHRRVNIRMEWRAVVDLLLERLSFPFSLNGFLCDCTVMPSELTTGVTEEELVPC
jgi:hypothetical protein